MSVVTVVGTPELSNWPPRVRLDVTDTGTSPAITSTTVARLDPDGRVVPVRTVDGNPLTLTTSGSDRVGLLYDYEMPYGAPVSYSTQESPAVISSPVTVNEPRVWLVHPGVPALSMPITVTNIPRRVRSVQRGVFSPMGRRSPVVQTDGQRKSAEYDLAVRTFVDSDRAAMDTLIDDAGVLLLNIPADKGWGVEAGYVSIGDVVESRQVDYGTWPRRDWLLPCVVVDRPVGGSQSQRTYVDLLDFATYADLRAAYPTYLDLLAGP